METQSNQAGAVRTVDSLQKYALTGPGPTLAEALGAFAAELSSDTLPDEVAKLVELHIADSVGNGFAGATQPFAQPVLELVASAGGNPHATVWGVGQRTSASMAALANGVTMHGLDFDDTHTGAIVHAGAMVVPAALAVGEWKGASGAEVVVAAAAGYETAVRIGLAAPGRFHSHGFHATPLAGAFGAAVTTAKLLKLDAAGIAYAIGIVGSQASGIHEYAVDFRSWMKRFHAGWAAHGGVIGAQMAAGGFTSPRTVLEGPMGLFATHVGPDEWTPAVVTDRLGEHWETLDLSFKPYPSCHLTHSFIDAARELRGAVAVDSIESMHFKIAEGMLDMVEPWEQKLHPADEYAAKFSLPYCVAALLWDGEVTVGSFGEDKIRRPDVLALASKASYELDPHTTFPKAFPGEVTIRTVSGEALNNRMENSRGTPTKPLTEDEVHEKFVGNVALGRHGEHAERLWTSLSTLCAQDELSAWHAL
ncbi:MAG TPA: MmgE/PrpD family protein [Solirubrobacteraceae bacterium]|nr:MmgE/PrpD family protein [Solirubrobacteraceae bacterium]